MAEAFKNSNDDSVPRSLFEHIVEIWKTFDSDAERVLVLTGHELTGHFHNAGKRHGRRCIKDSMHAARRVLHRPWRADSELHGILSKLVTGKRSLPRIITASNVLKGIFGLSVFAKQVQLPLWIPCNHCRT